MTRPVKGALAEFFLESSGGLFEACHPSTSSPKPYESHPKTISAQRQTISTLWSEARWHFGMICNFPLLYKGTHSEIFFGTFINYSPIEPKALECQG